MSSHHWRVRLVGVDLSDEARTIIEDLIAENERLRAQLEDVRLNQTARPVAAPAPGASSREAPSRAPTLDTRRFSDTRMLITASAEGGIKRTELNLYYRQRRAGLGNYDLKTREGDPVQFLAVAETTDTLLVLSQSGRAYRLPVADIPQTERNARGESLPKLLNWPADERQAAILGFSEADQERYVILGSRTGFVKRMRGHYFGSSLEQGKVVLDPRQTGGPAATMCLSNGKADILMVSSGGMSTRFNISTAPLQAGPGIKLSGKDTLVGIAPVFEESVVVVVTRDGLGTRRLMEGFTPNKAPGAAGKIMMKSDEVVGIAVAPDEADLVCLTSFGKLIRFTADEIPAKTAPVQGVDIVDVRGDAVTAVLALE
ncbi:MAG: hypothetical protein KIT87_24000 [Anaerolineae bacterium]|nr:hypothetical protein [Anaerolineae bacterium]